MKILMHFNGDYAPSTGGCGSALDIGYALSKKGIQVDWLFGFGKQEIKWANFYLNKLNGKLKFLFHSPITAIFFANFIKDKEYDIVHSHTLKAAFDAVIARALLRKKYKVVVHLQDLNKAIKIEWLKELKLKHIPYNFKTDLYFMSAILKEYFATKMADAFISISKSLEEELEKCYGAKSFVIPHSTSCKDFQRISRRTARKKLGLKSRDFVVLFVGGFPWRKGLYYLVEAVKGMKGTKLLIVGPDQTDGIKLANNCVMIGPVEKKNVGLYYSAADIFCMPSLHEPFGLVYAEAMCFGLPAIGSRGTGAEETIEHGKNGFLVEKRDAAAIKEALEKLKDKKTLKKMRANALRKAKRLSWEKVAQEIIKVYKEVLTKTN